MERSPVYETKQEQLMREYHAYTCKMSQLHEAGHDVSFLGYGDWLEQRTDPARPNPFDDGR